MNSKIVVIIVVVIIVILFFVPIYPTNLMCPDTVSYCSEIKGDSFSIWEYMQVAQPP